MKPTACVAVASAAVLLVVGPATAEPPRPAPTKITVADGVYLFTTPGYGDVGLDGNSVAIVTNEGVLVFDANGTPSAAEAVLAQIRALTNQPVRYVVYSHWHWDHWYGTEVYRAAFPGLSIVAHAKTREMMLGPAIAFNQPGLDRDLPGYIASLERRQSAAETASRSDEAARWKRLVDEDRFFLEQKRAVRHVLPNTTFTGGALDLYLGGRHIQVRHHDRAVTPGDAFIYLPDEGIVVTGDLLVNPVSFALSCYPSGWISTLEQIDALAPRVIVPGHGEPLHDRALLRATLAVFRELVKQGREAKARGLDVDAAADAIQPSLGAFEQVITHGDRSVAAAFRVQLVEWFLSRVYDEADGPLTDAIAPIPQKPPARRAPEATNPGSPVQR
jgi:glyoxylase-like metal-dependent hydrolase (beta-lactamase superfamily II)